MRINDIVSMVDLVHYYWLYDKNENGKIEKNEITEDVSRYDRNGDGAFSPWEVMEAVNTPQRVAIFSPQEISKMRKENEAGRSNIPAYPKREEECRALIKKISKAELERGKLIALPGLLYRFTYSNIHLRGPHGSNDGYLACDSTFDGIKFSVGTSINVRKIDANWPGEKSYPGGRYSLIVNLRGGEVKERSGIKFRSEVLFDIRNKRAIFEGGRLAEDVVLKNGKKWIKYKAGEQIYFDEGGKVGSGVIAEEVMMNSIKWELGSLLSFGKRGELVTARPKNNKTINKYSFKAGEAIDFNEKGNIYSGTLTENIKLIGTTPKGEEFEIVFSGGDGIVFHDFEKGIIRSGTLASDAAIGQFAFKKGTLLDSYYSNDGKDRISKGTLARDAVVLVRGEKVKFKAGTEIEFYQNGDVKEK